MYINREIEPYIKTMAESFPCIALFGARQTGKSTSIDHIFGNSYKKITLDDLDDRLLAENNPRLFLENYGWPLAINEIQKAPALLDEIKKNIDSQRLEWLKTGEKRRNMYVLTVSNRFELAQGVADSLAGRCGIIEMSSFSLIEKNNAPGHLFSPDIKTLREREAACPIKHLTRKEIFSHIFEGGMPDVCLKNAGREDYFKSYISTYIEKDIRKLTSAGSETQFRNFISLAALRTGCELHYEELSSSAGIDVRTCKRWISILESSGIICLVQPYMANMSSRIIKAPKIYFMDTGLCSYLCKWPNAEMLEGCAMSGAFFETFIAGEIIKNLRSYGKDPREHLFYYRDTDKKEIDLIFADGRSICPIEIKKGIAQKNAAKKIKAINKLKPEQHGLKVLPGLIIDSCEKIMPVSETAYYCPARLIGA